MVVSKIFFLLFTVLGCCDAFVTRSSSIVQKTVRQSSQVFALDPSHVFETASNFLADSDVISSDYIPGTSGDVSYSRASYYTILGLYLMSFPGIWSTIKRSTKAKVKRKTYVTKGESADGGKGLREQAGEIMAYMKANNYEVVEAGETITFRGIIQRSTSQAFFLVFCTAIGLASLALVLQIQFQDLGKNFLFFCLLCFCAV